MNRPPRSAWLALAFALATVPTASFAEEALGRLFLTPEKRDLLDRQRALNSLENQTLEEPQILINGQVRRSSGKRTNTPSVIMLVRCPRKVVERATRNSDRVPGQPQGVGAGLVPMPSVPE